MKKPILLTVALMASTITMAETSTATSDVKRLGVVTSSIVAGAASMGPVGIFPGMLVGIWLDHEIMDADKVGVMEQQLSDANSRIEHLDQQLASYKLSTEEYARIALEQLQLELLFKTNNSALTQHGEERLIFLADFLSENPDIQIRLDGYADPRGNALQNQMLSEQRVESVFNLLVNNGVKDSRIEKYSHGASQSLSVPGDYDSYALDRVVKIQLFQQDNNAIAGIMISD